MAPRTAPHDRTTIMPQPDPAPQRSTQRPAPPDLSLNKILAAAGAAVTSAVLGSLFGVAGTVLGAAVGAVASTVATSLYQRSLDRARSAVATHVPQVTARLRGGADPEATVVMPPPALADDPRTELIAPQVPGRSRQRVAGYVVATVLGFALALGAVTAVEAIKGSTLVTGQAGTSVGRVLQGGGATAAPTPEPTPDSSGSGDSDRSDRHRDTRDDSGDPSATKTPSPSSSTTPSPTESATPSRSGGLLGGLGAPSTGANQ